MLKWHYMGTSIVIEEHGLHNVAEMLLSLLPPQSGASVIALQGDLGAGKTALTKALARLLGIEELVTSPTFVIMKSYAIPPSQKFTMLTHIDAYRIESDDELRVLGFEELLKDSKRLMVIEWPERIVGQIPSRALYVRIEIGQNGERIITYGD